MVTNGIRQVGYVRVSTLDQNTARQLEGVQVDKLFEDKASGRDTARPQLVACLDYLREGDTLHVHSIDRLARNLQDLLAVLSRLVDQGVTVTFHKEGLSFTGEDNPFQKLQLQLIGAVAEFERSLIKERQREGIALAKQAGKYRGRKVSLAPEQVKNIQHRHEEGEQISRLAQDYGVSRQTLYSALKRLIQ